MFPLFSLKFKWFHCVDQSDDRVLRLSSRKYTDVFNFIHPVIEEGGWMELKGISFEG